MNHQGRQDSQSAMVKNGNRVPLIIPVENQVRELDPKLLLACVAAQRGFHAYIGSRREIHFHITSFPQGIYLSKSVTAASDMMFRIMQNLGHRIVAWDEEALVHLPAEIYYSRRLSPRAMARVSHFFAWGEDNVELWRQYPELPNNAQIHATGNPRNDLLRPELHAYYDEEVDKIRRAYGNFILVNTNFNHVNAFTPVQNLFQAVNQPGDVPEFGRAAKGMTREYAEGLQDLKKAVFEDFKRMIPGLDKAFPDHTILVRPHPTENQDIYQDLAARCHRVKVTNEGNVVPWLLAAKALVHNGCTTGVEAYVMKVPAVTYRASIDERYDFGFYRLPNLTSHPCFSYEELESTLKRILNGELDPTAADLGSDRKEIIDHYLAAQTGPLACERMVDVLETMVEKTEWPRPGFSARLRGWSSWAGRTMIKRYKDSRPGSHNRPEFQQHRYPDLTLEEMRTRVAKLQKIMNMTEDLKIEPAFDKFFCIRP
jgi:surface carbohydrate biosynthesis protein